MVKNPRPPPKVSSPSHCSNGDVKRCATCGHTKESHIGGTGNCWAEVPLEEDPLKFKLCDVCEKFEPKPGVMANGVSPRKKFKASV
jgi:hypothetical protein